MYLFNANTNQIVFVQGARRRFAKHCRREMGRTILTAFIIALAIATATANPSRDRNTKNKRIVCYLGTWAYYRHGDGAYDVLNMDPHLCTHLIYGFAKLENDMITPFDPYLDLEENWGRGYYKKFNSLRQSNPGLTTIIAIGGWNEGSQKYSDMARDPNRRRTFVNSVLNFLQRYDFDGLDFDWEYPASREGSREEDKHTFVQVLKELKQAFLPYGYVLTAAVSAGKHTIDPGYDIPNIAKYLDFMNLMAYDYHGTWDRVTGHNSPLYARPNEGPSDNLLNVNYSVNYWLGHGFPKAKMVLGMPLYGRCFYLVNAASNGLGAPSTGPGLPGPFTNEPGMIGYNELCLSQKNEGSQWKITRDPYVVAPYTYKGNQWCGYDDPTSLGVKAEYLKSMGLSGAMVWSLETDDFRGRCSGITYPLLKAINEKLQDHNVVNPTPPPIFTLEPPVMPTTTKETIPEGSDWCVSEGSFGFQGECLRYYQCIHQSGKLRMIPRTCPTGTAFDLSKKICVHSYLVAGCGRLTTYFDRFTTQKPTHTTTIRTETPEVVASSTRAHKYTTIIPKTASTRIHEYTTRAHKYTTIIPKTASTRIHEYTTRIPETPHGSESTRIQVHTTKSPEITTRPPVISSTVVYPTTKFQNNVTTTAPNELTCTSAGTFPHPTECKHFYRCQKTSTGFKTSLFTCPSNLVYNPKSSTCDYMKNVPSCQSTTRKPGPVVCGSEGYYPYPGDCTFFIHCLSPFTDPNEWIVFKCPAGLYYKASIRACDWEKPEGC